MADRASFFVWLVFVVSVGAQVAIPVFSKGEGGYFCIKIPDLLLTKNGTLLAFGEARKPDCSDYTWTDLVMKSSHDMGKTWSEMKIVYSNSTNATHAVVGNAAPVQDRVTGRIVVPFCKNNFDVFVTYSEDDGETWSAPNFLDGVTDPSWKWVGTGPPATLQMSASSKYPNRLVTCSYHSHFHYDDGELSKSHVIISDDLGDTWRLGGTVPGEFYFTNECEVIELPNGTLFMNSRGLLDHRLSSYSADGGETWSEAKKIEELVEPLEGCEGSMAVKASAGFSQDSNISENAKNSDFSIFFSIPNNPSFMRYNLTLWESQDQSASWQVNQVIESGRSAYSALQFLPDGSLAVLYERTNSTDPIFIPDEIVFKNLGQVG